MTRLFRHIALMPLLGALFISSCTKNEPDMPEEKGQFVISVSQLEYSESGAAVTKAVNSGYTTEFETGEQIGVTAVDASGNVISECNNVKFTRTSDGGWVNDAGYGFVEKYRGARYFAYYPYDQNWNGKTRSEIISGFTPLADQSTKVNYDKSDLMTVENDLLPESDTLAFVLKHQMSLISIFYNNELTPQGDPLYTLTLISGSTPSSVDSTYYLEFNHRYLVKPGTEITLKGHLDEKNRRYFSYKFSPVAGCRHCVAFIGEPMVPYTDGVDLELENVEFTAGDKTTKKLGYKVYWSTYNLGESLSERYPYDPAASDIGTRNGSRNPYARGDYYSWGSTSTQYVQGYSKDQYFDQKFTIAPAGGTIRGTEYDVAHSKWWRGKWRLPTEDEFRAMIAGCDFSIETTFTDSNHRYDNSNSSMTVRVFKVTSKTNSSKFIYLAAGGYTNGMMSNIQGASSGSYPDAFYLTSSSSPLSNRQVSYFRIKTNLQGSIGDTGNRYTGMLVRPVYSPED